jgi:hypothetical protein
MRISCTSTRSQKTGPPSIQQGATGKYKPEIFTGHCKGEGGTKDMPLTGKNETCQRVLELYQ